MDMKNLLQRIEDSWSLEEKPCDTCKETVLIPRCRTTCEACEAKAAEVVKTREVKEKWERQRIPHRYWNFIPETQHHDMADKSCIIFGDIGTGKTHFASQILKLNGGMFFSTIEAVQMIHDNPQKMGDFKGLNALCLDDFTKLNPSDRNLEKLFELIDYRYREKKLTYLTCDTRPDDISLEWGREGQAIRSRIKEWMEKIHLEHYWR